MKSVPLTLGPKSALATHVSPDLSFAGATADPELASAGEIADL